jgi:hypothetical protein
MHAAPVADGSGFNAQTPPAVADDAGADAAENERCVPTLPKLTGTCGTDYVAQVEGCQQLPASGTICTSGAETERRCISRLVRSDGDGPASRGLTDEYGVHSTEYGVLNTEDESRKRERTKSRKPGRGAVPQSVSSFAFSSFRYFVILRLVANMPLFSGKCALTGISGC